MSELSQAYLAREKMTFHLGKKEVTEYSLGVSCCWGPKVMLEYCGDFSVSSLPFWEIVRSC